jgi:hypothetical protein
MGYSTRWFIPDYVMILEFHAEVTLEDVPAFNKDWNDLLSAGQAPVHSILDASKVVTYPLNLPQIIKHSHAFSNPALGWILPYGAPSSANMIASIVAQMMRRKFRVVDDLAGAVAFLKDADDRLADLDFPPT